MMHTLWQDLRYAARMLRNNPGFTAVAVLVLALGIGANTIIFSLVNGVLLRALPYRDSGRILVLWQSNLKTGAQRIPVSPGNFLDWKEENRVFEELAAIEPFGFDLVGSGEPETIPVWLVSEGFFRILGVSALEGRTFLPEEYRPGNERVVVLGYELWKQRFGADPSLIGRKLMLDRRPYTVVGVMPSEFRFPEKREIWAPKVFNDEERRRRADSYFNAIGRLKPRITVNQAQAEMNAVAAGLARQYPETNHDRGIALVPLNDQLVAGVRHPLLVFVGAVGLVLLIACANIANLLLARGAHRSREFAIRSALGAGQSRLIRQMLTESVLLGLLGGAAGILLAVWGLEVTLALAAQQLPRIDEIRLDGRVLGFAFLISLLTALLFGLAPAIQFAKPDLQGSLNRGGRTASSGLVGNHLRKLLVVTEVGLALVLLIGAGLLIRSFVRVLQVNPGFAQEGVLALQVFIWDNYPKAGQRAIYVEEMEGRIASLPGVVAVGAASRAPLIGIPMFTPFTVEGRPQSEAGQETRARFTVASVDYFRTMSIPLRRGRVFMRSDNEQAPPVALINESFARAYFPGEDPLGKKLRVRFGQPVVREIAGIVGDFRHLGLESQPQPELFVPHRQHPFGSITFLVRTSSHPQAVLPAIKNLIWSLDKDQPIYRATTIEQLISDSLATRRFHLFLLASFAGMALLLASLGIYGLVSFVTHQRTHEVGVRMTMGALPSDIMKMVLSEGARLAGYGVMLGLGASWLLTRFLQNLLFEIGPGDPLTFASVATLLLAVALVACYLPARRAAKLDPMVALRYE